MIYFQRLWSHLWSKGWDGMGRHGENIRKRKDGRWEGRFKEYSIEKNKIIYRSVYASSYDEVKRKLATQKKTCDNNLSDAQPGACTTSVLFETAAKAWLESVASSRKYSTFVKYQTIYSKHLADTIGSYDVTKITVALINEKISESASESLVKSIFCVVNQVFAFAGNQYAVAVSKLKRDAMKRKKKPVEVLSQEEQARLLSCIHRAINKFKVSIFLCLCTGLRLGEVCVLKWSDIDFTYKLITVSRTVQRIAVCGTTSKTILMETSPKSECSKRQIPISRHMLTLLSQFRNDKEYVFGGDKPLEPRTLQYRFKKYLREAEISDHNFHVLRHTFATNCVEKGTDAKSLSEMLGHADVRITLNRYVHPSMDVKRRHLDSLERFYGQIVGQTYQKTAVSEDLLQTFAD